MIGYAYVDWDNNLVYKPQQYIEVDNPGFWNDNQGYVQKVWRFDTEDNAIMKNMFRQIQEMGFKPSQLTEFAENFSYDLRRITRQREPVK